MARFADNVRSRIVDDFFSAYIHPLLLRGALNEAVETGKVLVFRAVIVLQ